MSKSETTQNDIEELASQLESIDIDLTVTLEPHEVVRYVDLKNGDIPTDQLREAWKVAVKDQMEQQHENRDQIKAQLIQQGVLPESVLPDEMLNGGGAMDAMLNGDGDGDDGQDEGAAEADAEGQ
jgi:hypothetical protein